MKLRCTTCNHENALVQEHDAASGIYCDMCGTELQAPAPKPPRASSSAHKSTTAGRGWPDNARRAQQRYGAAPIPSDRDALFAAPGSHLQDTSDLIDAPPQGEPLDPFDRRDLDNPPPARMAPRPSPRKGRRGVSHGAASPSGRRDRFNEADLLRAADGIPGAGKPTPSRPPAASRGPLPIPETRSEHAIKPAHVGRPGAPRKSSGGLMLFLLFCLLSCGALGVAGFLFEEQLADFNVRDLWRQIDKTDDDGPRTESEPRKEDEPPPETPAPEVETVGEAREVGKYIERIHTRPDGSEVRVWTPRELDTKKTPEKGARPAKARRTTPSQARRSKDKARPKGKAAYNFSLRDDQGRRVELNDQRGKIVVLNFYANWCPPCRAEIPDFARFAKTHKEVAVYGVLMKSGPFEQAAAKSRRLGVTYPILDGTPAVKSRYKVTAYPTTVIIDADGKEVKRVTGGIKHNRLKSMVDAAR